MEFYSRNHKPCRRFTPSSLDGLAPVYEERFDTNGAICLVETGKTDLNAFIQASKESTLVYNILDRFQRGDVGVLDKVRGFFADVTDMPNSLMEAHQLVTRIANGFDSLPSDIKSEFGNDVNGMLKAIDDGKFSEILSKFTKNEPKPGAGSDDQIQHNDEKGGNE